MAIHINIIFNSKNGKEGGREVERSYVFECIKANVCLCFVAICLLVFLCLFFVSTFVLYWVLMKPKFISCSPHVCSLWHLCVYVYICPTVNGYIIIWFYSHISHCFDLSPFLFHAFYLKYGNLWFSASFCICVHHTFMESIFELSWLLLLLLPYTYCSISIFPAHFPFSIFVFQPAHIHAFHQSHLAKERKLMRVI